MSENEEHFIKKIKNTLDEETLDSGTKSRLTQIRYKALESKSKGWFPEWMAHPKTQWVSVACALLLMIIYFNGPEKTQPVLEDLDLLASAEVLELYEELEFYAWLAEENVDAG